MQAHAFVIDGFTRRKQSEAGRNKPWQRQRLLQVLPAELDAQLRSGWPRMASKAGVEGLVRVLANEMRGRKVTVNAVAPGPVATELFLTGKTPEQIDHLSKLNPLERLGQVEDIANVVSLLAGPDGAWINGQILRANGGMS